MGQICAILSTRIRTLYPEMENNHTLKCWSCIFQTTQTYLVMLDNYQNNISMYGCSPIKSTKFYFMLKFYKARISECNVFKEKLISYNFYIQELTSFPSWYWNKHCSLKNHFFNSQLMSLKSEMAFVCAVLALVFHVGQKLVGFNL